MVCFGGQRLATSMERAEAGLRDLPGTLPGTIERCETMAAATGGVGAGI
jgi:hypothetical protein